MRSFARHKTYREWNGWRNGLQSSGTSVEMSWETGREMQRNGWQMNERTLTAVLSGLLLTTAALGQSTIIWDEQVNGSFANLPGKAFSVGTLGLGTNSLLGATMLTPNGVGGWGVDADYFRVTVPSGIHVTELRFTVDRDSWIWLGDATFSNEYGSAINPQNGDLLSQWGLGSLTAGAYGMYVSDYDLQTFPTAANYRLDFVVVPEPSACSLLLLSASGGLLQNRWRRTWRKTQP